MRLCAFEKKNRVLFFVVLEIYFLTKKDIYSVLTMPTKKLLYSVSSTTVKL